MNDVNGILEHYGIKGMKWGVRRSRGSDGRVKTSPASKAKSMTNAELKTAITRLELERRYVDLSTPRKNSGSAFAGQIGKNVAATQLTKGANAAIAAGLTAAMVRSRKK